MSESDADTYRATVLAWRKTMWALRDADLPRANALRELDEKSPLPRVGFDPTTPHWHEMHAAGWMPGGPRRREVWCPALGLVFDSLSAPGRFLAQHFKIMGEPVPLGACPSLHVLDTAASRAVALKKKVPTPTPESVTEAWR